jgi:hypothetical protein
MNAVPKTGHTCKFCRREYKEKFNLDRHIGYCEFTHKSRREREDEIEAFEKAPTVQELFNYVKEMSIRMDKLEKDNARLRVFAVQQRKKINILEWLNEKTRTCPAIDFASWVNALPIEQKLNTVFANDLLTGILRSLETGVDNISIDNTENLPICAFTQKANIFYIYDKDPDADGKETVYKWQQFTNKQLDRWLNFIGQKFSFAFKNWCDENKAAIDTNEDMMEQYYSNFQKVLGGKMSDDTRNHRIRQHMFGKIKQNMKNVIEFEFV